ncbi:hypothetical protein KUTeg_017976 [Tegillarca granosa]|uniref:Uncharacterized protein n=1 Tax=Tegillarca granosa TaxID=220873 RepID=A0ABQ9EM95_TEGGR|nr:hypothetical protein KUTeg_017976 [Tegillarca granosa]
MFLLLINQYVTVHTINVFGDGSVAQFKLSKGTAGSPMSVYWSWGVGVMMGIYVAGGVSDAINNFDQGTRHVDGSLGTAGIFSTYPQPFLSVYNGLGDQVFGTAILLICVLAITDENNMKPTKGLIPISMTYGFNCGYAINPARDLAPRIFTAIAGWGDTPFNYKEYKWFWIPVLGPHLGAIIGAFIYQLCVGLHWPRTYEITQPQSKTVEQTVGSSNEGYDLGIELKLFKRVL